MALGKGLGALIPELEPDEQPLKTYFLCPIDQIHPNRFQPRRRFSESELKELRQSIEAKGILQPLLVKKDGRREPWDRQKMIVGLEKACEKRPISRDSIDQFVDEIEHKLQDLGSKEVASSVIGEWVMENLSRLDEVAYVRFASVYRQFKDVNEFMDELKVLLESREEQ